MRLYVIGAPGSGKSHICKSLSDIWGIPWFDLNDVRFLELTETSMLDTKRQMVALQDWIFEAVFETGIWTEALEAADVVVILDTPWPIRVIRVARRFFTTRLETFRSPRNDSETSLGHMLHVAYTTFLYDTRLMPLIQARMVGVSTKTIRLRRNSDLLKLPILKDIQQEADQQ